MSQENAKYVDSEMIENVKISRSTRNKARFGFEFADGKLLGVNADQWTFMKANMEAIDAYIEKHNLKKAVSKRDLLKALDGINPADLLAAIELAKQQKAG